MGEKCAIGVSTVLAKKVECAGLNENELALVSAKCNVQNPWG